MIHVNKNKSQDFKTKTSDTKSKTINSSLEISPDQDLSLQNPSPHH